MSDTPYSNVVVVQADSASDNCVEIPVPPRGVLKRLVITQLDGTNEGFNARLYDRRDACPGQTQQATTTGVYQQSTEILPRSLHQLAADFEIGNGINEFQAFDLDIPYEVKTPLNPVSIANRGGLTMWLSPLGTGSKKFAVAYTLMSLQTG